MVQTSAGKLPTLKKYMYVIFAGPEEDLPRKLEYMEFVMHAPSDYYKASNSPYPLTDSEVNNYNGFIWTSMEPKERS